MNIRFYEAISELIAKLPQEANAFKTEKTNLSAYCGCNGHGRYSFESFVVRDNMVQARFTYDGCYDPESCNTHHEKYRYAETAIPVNSDLNELYFDSKSFLVYKRNEIIVVNTKEQYDYNPSQNEMEDLKKEVQNLGKEIRISDWYSTKGIFIFPKTTIIKI